jgi:dihydroneopterin aldolase
MSALLEKAFEEAKRLPENLQDELAAELLEDFENERRWQETLSKPQPKLSALGQRALERSRAGKAKKMGFDEL